MSKVFLSLLVILLITGPTTFMTALAIDLGGTKLSLAVLSQEGTMFYKEYTALDHRKGQEVGLLITAEINNKKKNCGGIAKLKKPHIRLFIIYFNFSYMD